MPELGRRSGCYFARSGKRQDFLSAVRNRCEYRVRVVGSLAVVVVFLTLASTAAAAVWGWEGTIGDGLGNGQCYFYPGQSSCSPWGPWYQTNAAHQQGPGTALAGFQTTGSVRGKYLTAGQSVVVYWWELYDNPQSFKGHVTHCTWSSLCWGGNWEYMWFRTYS
jgi:hypothetical protein